MQFKNLIVNVFLIIFFHGLIVIAQEQKPVQGDSISQNLRAHQKNADSKYSVFGPPTKPFWKFQLSYLSNNKTGTSSFNFYRKDQRDKTLYFSITNNGLDNTNQYRVQQISGAAILFPFNDDDKYQLDIGGTFDKIKSTDLNNKILFSRFTYRPNVGLWFRLGYEFYDGHDLAHNGSSYNNSTLSSYYFSAKYKIDFFSPIVVLGGGKINDDFNNRFGGGIFLNGPLNTYLFGGYIKSTDETENTRTLAIGRWAPFRSDGLPSFFFIWKHKSDYNFQLGGLFFGNKNLFVQPAALGMLTGMFVSSLTLRVNSQLRQRKLMAITDDNENSDYSFFYVNLNQKITLTNTVGFTALQFFKLFTNTKLWIISDPVIGIHYNKETNPIFDIKTFSLMDKKEDYFSYQIGIKIISSFLIDMFHSPTKKSLTIAFSYLVK